MKISIEAARALTLKPARVCDLENNNLRVMEFNKSLSAEEAKQRKADARVYKRLNGMLTPIASYYCSEMCNRVALRVHSDPRWLGLHDRLPLGALSPRRPHHGRFTKAPANSRS
jgi:hypothetical protein